MNDIEADLMIANAKIREQQAKITEQNHEIIQLKIEKEMIRQEWDTVKAQLSESQRREQAAVKDIEKMMRICEKGACHFCADGDCTESPFCSPKWRGPQAGEDKNG